MLPLTFIPGFELKVLLISRNLQPGSRRELPTNHHFGRSYAALRCVPVGIPLCRIIIIIIITGIVEPSLSNQTEFAEATVRKKVSK